MRLISSRRPAIEIEQPAQLSVSFDAVAGVGETWVRIDVAIADTLMWSSVIVEITRDVDSVAQAAIADEPELVQVFGFEPQKEAFDSWRMTYENMMNSF